MKILITFIITVFYILCNTIPCWGQKPTIKIGVYYTANAEYSMSNATRQEKNVQTVIENINQQLNLSSNKGYEIVFNRTKLENYKEPKHRDKGYNKYQFEGTTQVLEEMMMQYGYSLYYDKNTSTDVTNNTFLGKEFIDRKFIEIDKHQQSEINIIIVDEEGLPIVLTTNALDDTEFNNASQDIDKTLYAVINARMFNKDLNSLAVAIFSLLTNPDLSDYKKDDYGYFKEYSLLGYWLEEGKDDNKYPDALQLELSENNSKLFQCNMSKLNLVSRENNYALPENPKKRRRLNSINEAITQTNFDTKDNYAIVTDDEGDNEEEAIVLSVKGVSSYITFTNGRYATESYNLCPYVKSSMTRYNYSDDFVTSFDTEKEYPEPQKLSNDLHPYPNPTSDILHIPFILQTKNTVKISIHDVTGRLVDIVISNNYSIGKFETTWEANNFPSGVYFCTVKIGNDNIQRFKVIKQ